LQASPAQTKKQQEDADRAMKELLEEEDKDAAAAAAGSQKKKQAKQAGKERKRRDAADGQDGSQMEEHAEEQKDTERTEAKSVAEKNKTESVAAIAVEVAATLKDKAEERGGQEEEGEKQGTVERKKAEGVGSSQGIQVCGLPQEKDDDDGLPDESSAKRKSKSKKNRAGDQGASASKTAPWATEAEEAGTAAAGVGVEANS
jgi:hypothetical protein